MHNPKLDHIPDAKPSATVVLLRDRDNDIEVLMLQKNQRINYGGSWVFPGGVCDPEDYEAASLKSVSSAIEDVAKVTACRETMEEASLELSSKDLFAFAHWTTPKFRVKRYATWFFLSDANALAQDVVIDEGEIIQARWFTPSEAITAQSKAEVELNGPSFVTLSQLSQFKNTEQALRHYELLDVERFIPRGHKTDAGIATVYAGDKHYDSETLDAEIPEHDVHRLYMPKEGAWRYLKK